MKLTATMVGSLKADMQAELRRIERAVPDGVKAAGDGLNKGHDAASLVWSKAAQIVRAFDEGAVIKGKGGRWLAIPTPAAPKRGIGGKRITPATFPAARHGPLRMVRRSGRAALLVVDGVRVSARTGRVGRQAKGGGRTKSGSFKQGIATVAMFVLVPRVKLRKRLNVARAVESWTRRLPRLIRRQIGS